MTIEQLLRDKGIRPTPIRTFVLSLLHQSSRAYTHSDLERAFDQALDRVSLYRCLLTLTEAGLVQKHIDTKGGSSYFVVHVDTVPMDAACIGTGLPDKTSTATPSDYPHFKCNQCETVVSLPKLPEDYLALVRQYKLDNLRLLGEGTCNDCRHRVEIPS